MNINISIHMYIYIGLYKCIYIYMCVCVCTYTSKYHHDCMVVYIYIYHSLDVHCGDSSAEIFFILGIGERLAPKPFAGWWPFTGLWKILQADAAAKLVCQPSISARPSLKPVLAEICILFERTNPEPHLQRFHLCSSNCLLGDCPFKPSPVYVQRSGTLACTSIALCQAQCGWLPLPEPYTG